MNKLWDFLILQSRHTQICGFSVHLPCVHGPFFFPNTDSRSTVLHAIWSNLMCCVHVPRYWHRYCAVLLACFTVFTSYKEGGPLSVQCTSWCYCVAHTLPLSCLRMLASTLFRTILFLYIKWLYSVQFNTVEQQPLRLMCLNKKWPVFRWPLFWEWCGVPCQHYWRLWRCRHVYLYVTTVE